MKPVLLPAAFDLWLILQNCYYCKTKLTLEPMISDTETLILMCLYCHEISTTKWFFWPNWWVLGPVLAHTLPHLSWFQLLFSQTDRQPWGPSVIAPELLQMWKHSILKWWLCMVQDWATKPDQKKKKQMCSQTAAQIYFEILEASQWNLERKTFTSTATVFFTAPIDTCSLGEPRHLILCLERPEN